MVRLGSYIPHSISMIEIYYMFFNGYLLHLYTVRIPTLIGQKRLNVQKTYEKYDFFQVEFLSKYKIADTNILIFYEQKCGNELILMEKKNKKEFKTYLALYFGFQVSGMEASITYQYTIQQQGKFLSYLFKILLVYLILMVKN